ncbi:DUF1398 family protein [Citrobacter freundii]|nr:DUF1398 family protein [Citrobacter freundii]
MKLLASLRACFDKVQSDLDFCFFLNELKKYNVVSYVHFVSTGNTIIVTSHNVTFSLKEDRRLLKVNSKTNYSCIADVANLHFSGGVTYDMYCQILADAGVFKWSVDLKMENRMYWSRKNKLLHSEKLFKDKIID